MRIVASAGSQMRGLVHAVSQMSQARRLVSSAGSAGTCGRVNFVLALLAPVCLIVSIVLPHDMAVVEVGLAPNVTPQTRTLHTSAIAVTRTLNDASSAVG